MAKPVLGRGLGALLNGQRTKAHPTQLSSSSLDSTGPAVGRGLGTLLKGNKEAATPESCSLTLDDPDGVSERRIPAWYFFALDLVLLAFVALTILTSSPLDWLRILVCAMAIALGIILFCIPLWNHRKAREKLLPRSNSLLWFRSPGSAGNNPPRQFVVHFGEPVFVGEVFETKDRMPTIKPLWIEGKSELSNGLLAQIQREAERVLRD